MITQALLFGVSDRIILGLETQAHLGPRITAAVPSGKRVGTLRLLPFEFQRPAPRAGLAGLGRFAVGFNDTGNGNGRGLPPAFMVRKVAEADAGSSGQGCFG